MNLYILVEGYTEKNLYPEWLKYLWPELKQKEYLDDVIDNDYYIFTCGGIPAIIDDIPKAVQDIQEHGNIDYLLVMLDAEEVSVADRLQEVNEKVETLNIASEKVIPIVQNPCIETWLLGNSRLCGASGRTKEFQECLRFYNVRINDPEKMLRPKELESLSTRAQYHEYYLKKMFLEKSLRYRKGKISEIGKESYLNSLITRSTNTLHISSFTYFINSIKELRESISS